ncbi:hypothetical protein bpr_II122 (plasmid) [Butyrivibrio proteoclasticus B316]|uniref:Uncharacterized protein n=1 Tax=Butyrivibrio proteoclasticus (strain ATCC 51982 / DSM 14932 / B316) TaxID=515622 RepID=E0S3S9_BUTPB|nr:hypothetical protein [Butyrivibrio proteoclasticus]ADL36061.1 hypothetical protein bpr_II122 [Butyrivibrio proteoclasticus B316]
MLNTALKYNPNKTYTAVPNFLLGEVLDAVKKIDPTCDTIAEASEDYPEDLPDYAIVNNIPIYADITAVGAHVYPSDVQALMNEIQAKGSDI